MHLQVDLEDLLMTQPPSLPLQPFRPSLMEVVEEVPLEEHQIPLRMGLGRIQNMYLCQEVDQEAIVAVVDGRA